MSLIERGMVTLVLERMLMYEREGGGGAAKESTPGGGGSSSKCSSEYANWAMEGPRRPRGRAEENETVRLQRLTARSRRSEYSLHRPKSTPAGEAPDIWRTPGGSGKMKNRQREREKDCPDHR